MVDYSLRLLLGGYIADPSLAVLDLIVGYCERNVDVSHDNDGGGRDNSGVTGSNTTNRHVQLEGRPSLERLMVQRDSHGVTPLHLVSEGSCSFDFHERFLSYAEPEWLLERDKDGELPLHWALKADLSAERLHLYLGRSNAYTMHAMLDSTGQTALGSFLQAKMDEFLEESLGDDFLEQTWNYAVSVMRATGPTLRDQLDRPMHEVARMVDCRSRHLVRLATAFHPEAIRDRDDRGMLPLHVACSVVRPADCVRVPSSDSVDTTDQSGTNDQADVILEELLRIHPEAARVTCTDQGRLPLHYILSDRRCSYFPFVEKLVAAYPPAVSKVDPVTDLYPFALAATAGQNTTQLVSVETIFSILLADPSVLSMMDYR